MTIPPAIIQELLTLVPATRASSLLKLVKDENSSPERLETGFAEVLEEFDPDVWQSFIGRFVHQLMPVEQLVPDIYSAWRPIVRDALIFIAGHLPAKRLIPKLVEQVRLPGALPLEQRVIAFISQMPSLQKLGQIIARNQNLAADFRTQLMLLENEISDVRTVEVRDVIDQQLGQLLNKYQVELEETIHAEASVSAVMRFSWLDRKSGKREQGVLKVLKPFIYDNFVEEMELLQGLADYLDENREEHMLAQVNVRDIFDDIRILLQQEIDFVNEQANLQAACRRYKDVAGVRVPRLIQELSTSRITAMSAETGVKVTEAFLNHPPDKLTLATRIIEALVAMPLFSAEEEAVFHADPHAGNLFADEQSRELIIFDWALTDKIDRSERRCIVLLASAVTLRDAQLIFNALAALSKDDFIEDKVRAGKLRAEINRFLDELSIFTLPDFKQLLVLLDKVMLTGISFSASLLIFRKILMTLDGVLSNVSATVSLESVLTRYIVREEVKTMYGFNLRQSELAGFQFPLTGSDGLNLFWSAQWYGLRTSMQLGDKLGKTGLQMLQRMTSLDRRS